MGWVELGQSADGLGRVTQNGPMDNSETDRRTDGRTDGRTLDRFIDPASHTMRQCQWGDRNISATRSFRCTVLLALKDDRILGHFQVPWRRVLARTQPTHPLCVGCVHTPQVSKMNNKNTDTVYNAPCVEERSTFLLKTPPFSNFYKKKHRLILFPVYKPVCRQVATVWWRRTASPPEPRDASRGSCSIQA